MLLQKAILRNVMKLALQNGCGMDPKKCYEARFAKWMWYGFLRNVFLLIDSCGLIMAGKKKL